MLQDRFGNTELNKKFMRSLPKGWENSDWQLLSKSETIAIYSLLILFSLIAGWIVWLGVWWWI